MKYIARKWMAIAMAIALVFGCVLAEAESAAPEIDAEALYREGMAAYDAKDYATALEKFTPAAEAGYAPAQSMVGKLYHDGWGVEQDYAQAMEWYTKAAKQGDALAQTGLAVLYFEGTGVEQDYGAAAEWFARAAEQGEALAQAFLGLMYYVGYGVEQDYGAAIEWLTKAAEQEYPEMQYFLGRMYERGDGVEVDLEQALAWYQRAAENGDADAVAALARLNGASGVAPAAGSVTEITDKEQIKSAQGLLNALGYDCGTPDGIAGKKTQAAVTKFQQDNGLTVTGTITEEVMEALSSMASISSAP